MKNVLVINQYASTPEVMYGAGERIFHLSKYLYNDFNIEVLSSNSNHLFKNKKNVKKLVTSESYDHIIFHWIKIREYNQNSFFQRALSWIEFAFKLFFFKPKMKPDVVLLSSMSIFPIFYAYYLKIKYKSKLILEIRDIWPLTPIELGGYSKFNPLIILFYLIENFAYRVSDSIISVLPSFYKHLKNKGFFYKRFYWIPNGIIINEKSKNESLNIFHNKKFNIVYAGTLGKANALENLIDCIQNPHINTTYHFNFIGSGPLENELKKKLGLCNNVTFHKPVLKDQLNSILKNADVAFIGWHDRKIYDFGVAANKYNDYMLASLPIISSSKIPDDPVKLSNSGLIVNPNNSSELKDAIDYLYLNPEIRKIFGHNGYNYLINTHSYEKLSKKYKKVLNER